MVLTCDPYIISAVLDRSLDGVFVDKSKRIRGFNLVGHLSIHSRQELDAAWCSVSLFTLLSSAFARVVVIDHATFGSYFGPCQL